VAFAPFPDLPDDNPIEALRIFRNYARVIANQAAPYRLLVSSIAAPILMFGVVCLVLGFEVALSWATDLVPLTFAVISVVVSVKKLRDEHQTVVIAFVLILGFLGTMVMHFARTHDQTAHGVEVRDLKSQLDILRNRMDSVRDQNGQLLTAFLKPVPTSQEAELERRQNIENTLRGEYILSHENVSPGLLSGTELPPADWMNKRLHELGEKWTVAIPSPPKPAVIIPEPKLARLQFSFWSDALNSAELMPIREITVPRRGKSVTLDFTVGNVGEATASNIDIWMSICMICAFAKEPDGFSRPRGLGELYRWRLIQRLSVGTYMEKMTAEVVPPPANSFNVDFISTCDTCDGQKKEKFIVHVVDN